MRQIRNPIVQCWSVYPMSSTSPILHPSVMSSMNKPPSHEGYSSADSESKKQHHRPGQQTPPQSGERRRPSRAGTRSVSTLSQAQLERKRANDREAQRAIRQRTKDHIEALERRISELTSNDVNARLVETLEQNHALQDENSHLRTRIQQLQADLQGPASALSAPDRLGIMPPPRSSSTPVPRHMTTGMPPVSHSEWSQHTGYNAAPTSAPLDAPAPTVHQDSASASDIRWSPHSSVSHSLPPVPETSFHNVEQPQMSYYGTDSSARSVPYATESAPNSQTLPYGNPPPHQPPHTPAQGTQQAYAYSTHAHPDYHQQRSIPSQPTSYQSYNHPQAYLSSPQSHTSSTQVQHAGESLQMMQQQTTPQSQGAHMMYNMKVEQ